MAKSYMKTETPEAVQKKALEVVEAAQNSGVVKKGTNETTKAIERGEAKLVLIAGDVDPEEIVMHLPVLCEEKRIPFAFIAEKKVLGKAAGLSVSTAAVAVSNPGTVEQLLKEVVSELPKIEVKVEAKAETPKPPKPKRKPRKKKAEAVPKEEVPKEEAPKEEAPAEAPAEAPKEKEEAKQEEAKPEAAEAKPE